MIEIKPGVRFGRLTVKRHDNHLRWECLCDCGQTKYVLPSNLRGGNVKSCGCLRKEYRQQRAGEMFVRTAQR